MNPNHIAIIMDGNGRWAENSGKGRKFGHQKGAKSAREVVRYIGSLGIEYLTLYAFSTENWGRPIKEVNLLMSLFIETLELEINDLNNNDVKIKFIGDRTSLKDSLVKKIEKAELLTATNEGLKLSVALAYGGRWDIVNATKILFNKINELKISLKDVDEKLKYVDDMQTKVKVEKAENELSKLHPDFEELRMSEQFHQWVSEQPKWIQSALYENDTDHLAAGKAIDLYKLETKTSTKKDTTDAAKSVSNTKRSNEPTATSRNVWSESRVKGLSSVDWDKHEEDIQASIREGTFVYDLTGGAR